MSEIIKTLKTKCCNANVLKAYNEKNPGYEETFYCCNCDKELDLEKDIIIK